jgi:phosphatidate cytidylyltransferase
MLIRAISALIAAALLASVYIFLHNEGVLWLCALIVGAGIIEYSRLTLARDQAPLYLRSVFVAVTAALFLATIFGETNYLGSLGAGAAAVVLLSVIVISTRAKPDLARALRLQNATLMGLFYCGIFAGFVVRPLRLPNGDIYFFGLLAIVFSGDTCAYLAGRFFGRNKLLESISPKKTIEGAIGGLAGSALAGLVLGHYFMPECPLPAVILTAMVTGVFAQIGDLFESLLKRLADVKDSGSIMPGHGGILDRLDGVIFAGPIYYALVMAISSFWATV